MAVNSAPLRRLGAELKRLRVRTGRSQLELARSIGRTQAAIANWEGGRNLIGENNLDELLAELNASDEEKDVLRNLHKEADRGESQWATYGLPEWLRPYVSFEEEASAIESLTLTVIPGLLQTESYARALHVAAPYMVTPSDIDRWVNARLQRQKRLEGPNPVRFHAVIPESALALEVGGSGVMSEQLEKLIDYAQKPHITIQVLPSARGAHPALACSFVVLSFDHDDPLGYYDSPFGGNLVSGKRDVDFLTANFRIVRDLSLTPSASLKLLQKTLDRYLRREPQS